LEKHDFCDNWHFRKNGEDLSQAVTLPHDASFNEKRIADSPGGSAHGYFPGGSYEYEKTFFAPEKWRDQVVIFQFGGVYKDSSVYINGKRAGGCVYGYSEFTVNAEGLLDFGRDNVIKVTADNTRLPDSRWYTGAGIYRPVILLLGNRQHIRRRGVKISTVSVDPARVLIETKYTSGEVTIQIYDGTEVVAHGAGSRIELTIPDARLWSDEHPNLYRCRAVLRECGEVVDEVTEPFGIRQITWSNKGLFINGKETLLRGGCVHSDNGILGACSYQKAEERRVRILKEAGFNAIRASHNPASEFLLDACDKLGVYVMDETWDMWYSHKSAYDYAGDFEANYMFDIESLVERDYNHPSVIMYSIANEVSEPSTEKGVELTKRLVAAFHDLDQSRPVTAGINLFVISRSARGNPIYKEGGGLNVNKKSKKGAGGMNSTMFNLMTSIVGTGMNKAANSSKVDAITKPCLDALDIAGYNYASGRYPLEAKANPNRLIAGTETFPQDIAKNWAMVEKYPYLIGDFMWTAWDYLGETSLGAWAYTEDGNGFNKPYPWLLADTGAFDILGDPNGEAFLAQTIWGFSRKPIIGVQPVKTIKPSKGVWRGTNAIPSWSWRGCDGIRAVVEVFSDAHTVRLSLNGKTIGKKQVKNGVAKFSLRYSPGELSATAYDTSGKETGRHMICTATGKIGIGVTPEEQSVCPDDIAFIPVTLDGENGITESNTDAALRVCVENGELLAFGSANPRTEESFTSGQYTTYYGRALAVVRAGKTGVIRLAVTGDGFEPASAEVKITDHA